MKKSSSVTRRSFRSNTRGRDRALIWLSAVNLGLLITLYIIESRTAERQWLGTLITYAPQHFYCLPSLVLLVWAGFRRNGRAMAINLAALVFFGTALLGFCVPWRAGLDGLGGPHAQPKHIRVMTYNIHHSQNGGILVAAEIRKAKPDVVFLQEANALLNVTRRISGPLIVAGDFNTPPRGEVYRRMSADLTDAFGYAGWGVGYTFRSDVPAMRIDYVFLGNGVRAERCWTPHTEASDHLPLVADVELPR